MAKSIKQKGLNAKSAQPQKRYTTDKQEDKQRAERNKTDYI
jgi:hypothetical protein